MKRLSERWYRVFQISWKKNLTIQTPDWPIIWMIQVKSCYKAWLRLWLVRILLNSVDPSLLVYQLHQLQMISFRARTILNLSQYFSIATLYQHKILQTNPISGQQVKMSKVFSLIACLLTYPFKTPRTNNIWIKCSRWIATSKDLRCLNCQLLL